MKISQVGSIAEGAFATSLSAACWPGSPTSTSQQAHPDTITEALKSLGYDVVKGSDSRLYLSPSTQRSGTSGPRSPTPARDREPPRQAAEHATARLTQARQRGGFIALKAPIRDAVAIRRMVTALDGVTGVNVTTEFVRILRAVVAERARPKLETVLAADSQDASPNAKNGFAELLQETWTRLEDHIRALGNSGIVLLHDATPIARYVGGAELLAKLAVAARDANESPWPVAALPHGGPAVPPQLDRVTVSVIPGDAEQLYVPGEFANGDGKEQKAS